MVVVIKQGVVPTRPMPQPWAPNVEHICPQCGTFFSLDKTDIGRSVAELTKTDGSAGYLLVCPVCSCVYGLGTSGTVEVT